MTVEVTTNRITYTGNGVTDDFDFTFKYFNDNDLKVYKDGVLVNSDDYTITANPAGEGGTVTFDTVPANGTVILILRDLAYTQGSRVPVVDKLGRGLLENMIDKNTMLTQQLKDTSDRSVKLATTYTASFDPTLPTTLTAGRALMINDAGTGIKISNSAFDSIVTNATAQAAAAAASANAAAVSAAAAALAETNAETAETNAEAAEALAEDWATKTTATVDGAKFSSKEYAQGTQAATGGSAKNWAQQIGGDVTGAAANSKSAKAWAQESLTGATLGGSAKDWAQVTGAAVDGSEYSAKEYAIGTTVAAGSAKDWAITAENTLVDGAEYSAKHYAAKAAASAASVNLRTINAQSAGYTIVASDRNKLINYTGTGGHTIAFTAAATLGSGFEVEVRHGGSGAAIVLDPTGSETIGGSATISLAVGQAVVVVCDGSNWLITQAYGYGAGVGDVIGPVSTTQYKLPYWDSASKTLVDGVAPGTSGNVLTSNGTVWTSAAPASQSLDDLSDVVITTPADRQILAYNGSNWVNTTASWVLLDTKTASNSSSLDFTTSIDSTYDVYVFEMVNIIPVTDATSFHLRVSTDGGSTYKAGASDYNFSNLIPDSAGGAPSASASTGAAQIQIGGASLMGNSTGEALSGTLKMIAPASTAAYHIFHGTGGGYTATPRGGSFLHSSTYLATTAINAVRFLMSSGNISSGKIRLYGVKQ